MEDRTRTGKDLHQFERTYFERLRLAALVILEAAPDLELVTDPLEVELQIFKERVEILLLLPDDADSVLTPAERLKAALRDNPADEGLADDLEAAHADVRSNFTDEVRGWPAE